MGFSSFSDFLSEVTTGGKYRLSPFAKVSANGGAGTARDWYEMYTATGVPGAGVQTGAAGTGVAITQATQGAGIYVGADVSAETRHATSLQLFSNTATMVPTNVFLVDFLAYYPAIVLTGTATTLTEVALPRYADGHGVMLVCSIQAAMGAAMPALTFTCHWDDGTTSAAAPAALTCPRNSAVTTTLLTYNTLPWCPMAAGKNGIIHPVSYTIASGTTGTGCIFLVKVLAELPLSSQYIPTERDFMNQIAGMPQIYDGACLGFIVQPGGAFAQYATLFGNLGMAWG